MAMHIEQAIALVSADAARIERYVERRECFLDALDWSAMSGRDVIEAAMLDDLFETDLAEASSYIMHLASLAAEGISEIDAVVRFAPYPRPWHSAWKTLPN
jgi:hypothetical protein